MTINHEVYFFNLKLLQFMIFIVKSLNSYQYLNTKNTAYTSTQMQPSEELEETKIFLVPCIVELTEKKYELSDTIDKLNKTRERLRQAHILIR